MNNVSKKPYRYFIESLIFFGIVSLYPISIILGFIFSFIHQPSATLFAEFYSGDILGYPFLILTGVAVFASIPSFFRGMSLKSQFSGESDQKYIKRGIYFNVTVIVLLLGGIILSFTTSIINPL